MTIGTLLASFLFLVLAIASTQSEAADGGVPSTDELTAFFDERVPALLDAFDVPGGAVTVVTPHGPLLEAG